MDRLEALDRAAVAFETRLKAVTISQWNAPTPCEDWIVRRLVGHVVAGNRIAVPLLAGASAERAAAALDEDPLGDDPVAPSWPAPPSRRRPSPSREPWSGAAITWPVTSPAPGSWDSG
jgi:Mycothiol maleylpyruvate isomerase N-terminal domain